MLRYFLCALYAMTWGCTAQPSFENATSAETCIHGFSGDSEGPFGSAPATAERLEDIQQASSKNGERLLEYPSPLGTRYIRLKLGTETSTRPWSAAEFSEILSTPLSSIISHSYGAMTLHCGTPAVRRSLGLAPYPLNENRRDEDKVTRGNPDEVRQYLVELARGFDLTQAVTEPMVLVALRRVDEGRLRLYVPSSSVRDPYGPGGGQHRLVALIQKFREMGIEPTLADLPDGTWRSTAVMTADANFYQFKLRHYVPIGAIVDAYFGQTPACN